MSIVDIGVMRDYLRAEQPLDEDWLQGSLDTAHSVFYDMCQRSFEVAGVTAAARLYVPSGTSVLRIHDCTTITAVTNNGTAITSYQAEPFAPTLAGETLPYEQIRLLGSCWDQYGYPGQASVSVTAKWGWTTTPAYAIEGVKLACKDIATNRDTRGGYLSFDAGVAAARRNPAILDLVQRFGRSEALFGIA